MKKYQPEMWIRRRALKLFDLPWPITFEVEPKDNNDLTYEKIWRIYRAKQMMPIYPQPYMKKLGQNIRCSKYN